MEGAPGGTAGPGWHSYRCPVCGHTDEVELAGEAGGTIPCSHCGTSLDLVVRSPDEASLAVKVASRRRRTR
ncbi:MAG: hypothetical protein AMXMBFR53_05740 [Gemmatimonadota bacterium]